MYTDTLQANCLLTNESFFGLETIVIPCGLSYKLGVPRNMHCRTREVTLMDSFETSEHCYFKHLQTPPKMEGTGG